MSKSFNVYLRQEDLAPADIKLNDGVNGADDDDWDTDTDYVNDISEKDQRWGSKIIQPDKNHFKMDDLRSNVIETHENMEKDVHSSQVHKYGEQ